MPGDSMETHVVIRDTATGKLLRNAELFSRTIDAEGVRKIGWMPEGTTIFFSITGGIDNDDALWTTRSSPIGTYVMNEDAGPAERLAPEATLHPKIAGLDPLPDAAAVLIGRLPDARYLLSDVEYSHTHPHQEKCLYALDVAQKTQKLLNARRDHFSTIYPGHGPPLPGTFVPEQIGCVEGILNGTLPSAVYHSFAGDARVSRFKSAQVAFNPEKLRAKKGDLN
jgi:hypothetical protein